MSSANYFPQVPLQLGISMNIIRYSIEIIVSPGVSIKEPAIAKQSQRNIPIIGDIELFARRNN